MASSITPDTLYGQYLPLIVHSFKCLNNQLSGQTAGPTTACPEVLCPTLVSIIRHCVDCTGDGDERCPTGDPSVCRFIVWLIKHWNSCPIDTNCHICQPIRTDIILKAIINYVINNYEQQLFSRVTATDDQLMSKQWQSCVTDNSRQSFVKMIVQSMTARLANSDDKVMNQLMTASVDLERQAFDGSNTREEYYNFVVKYVYDIQGLQAKTLEEYSMNEFLESASTQMGTQSQDNCFAKDVPKDESAIDKVINWFHTMNI